MIAVTVCFSGKYVNDRGDSMFQKV